jgi:hypothetical protein
MTQVVHVYNQEQLRGIEMDSPCGWVESYGMELNTVLHTITLVLHIIIHSTFYITPFCIHTYTCQYIYYTTCYSYPRLLIQELSNGSPLALPTRTNWAGRTPSLLALSSIVVGHGTTMHCVTLRVLVRRCWWCLRILDSVIDSWHPEWCQLMELVPLGGSRWDRKCGRQSKW